MKKVLVVALVLLLLFSAGCTKSLDLPQNESTAPNADDYNRPVNDTIDNNAEDNTEAEPEYQEDVPLFVCQDRADIEGDRDTIYFYNYKGDVLKSIVSSSIGFYAKNGLAPAYDSLTDRIGFVDRSGVFVIEPQWDDAAAFSDDGVALVILEEEDGAGWHKNKYGFINEKGEYIAHCVYDTATSFYPEGVAIIGIEGEVEYTEVDENGTYCTYTDKGKKLGVIDKTGKIIVEPEYTYIQQINGEYIYCSTVSTTVVYDLSGNVIVGKDDYYIDETHTYFYTVSDGKLYRCIREQLLTGPMTVENEDDYYKYKYSTNSIYDGEKFVREDFDVNKPYIHAERVATTSSGYGYGVRKNSEVVIPYQYDQMVQYNSFYVGIKYRNGDKTDQILDIYNQNFEKTAENLNYNFKNRIALFGISMILPDGYFEVSYYDDNIGEYLSGIIDSNGQIIVPLLYYRPIELFTYEAIGGKFTY